MPFCSFMPNVMQCPWTAGGPMRSVALFFTAFIVPAISGAEVLRLEMDSVVHPITVEMTARAIHQASEHHASMLLVRLNTPGGLMDASREVVEKLLASPVPVITYVTPA